MSKYVYFCLMLPKEQIIKELEEMDGYLPISKIEERLGMPPTTLQKVLKGTRKLPKKWEAILEKYFVRTETKIVNLNLKNQSPTVYKKPLNNQSINTATKVYTLEELESELSTLTKLSETTLTKRRKQWLEKEISKIK